MSYFARAAIIGIMLAGATVLSAQEAPPPPPASSPAELEQELLPPPDADTPLPDDARGPNRAQRGGPFGKAAGRDNDDRRGHGAGRGDRDWGGRRGGPTSRPDNEGLLSPKEIEQVMEFVKAKLPELHEKMVQTRQRDRVCYFRMFRRVGPPLLNIYRTEQRDPDLADKLIASFKTEMDIDTLREDYRSAVNTADRERIKSQLREKLAERFDQRMARLELEIKRLENRLNDAKARLQAQQKAKNTLIDDELSREVLDLPDHEQP